jgi:crotonobetainyl-CoA:carnitine CoA-transferase CaiB-like acyl-CoA transferase
VKHTIVFIFVHYRFSKKTLADWLLVFDGTDMPYGPINNMEAVFKDSQVQHNNIVQTISDLQTYNSPIKVPGK